MCTKEETQRAQQEKVNERVCTMQCNAMRVFVRPSSFPRRDDMHQRVAICGLNAVRGTSCRGTTPLLGKGSVLVWLKWPWAALSSLLVACEAFPRKEILVHRAGDSRCAKCSTRIETHQRPKTHDNLASFGHKYPAKATVLVPCTFGMVSGPLERPSRDRVVASAPFIVREYSARSSPPDL